MLNKNLLSIIGYWTRTNTPKEIGFKPTASTTSAKPTNYGRNQNRTDISCLQNTYSTIELCTQKILNLRTTGLEPVIFSAQN